MSATAFDADGTVSDQMALALSNLLVSIDPDDSDALEKAISDFNASEDSNKQSTMASDSSQNIFQNMQQYHAMTDLVGQMNEAHNANEYADRLIQSENARLIKLNYSLRKELYKMQQRYLTLSYKRQHVRFVTNIMLMTMFVTCLLAFFTAVFLQGLLMPTLYMILVFIILTLYSVGMIIAFAKAARRRNNHWKQFYWSISDNLRRSLNNKKNSVNDEKTTKC